MYVLYSQQLQKENYQPYANTNSFIYLLVLFYLFPCFYLIFLPAFVYHLHSPRLFSFFPANSFSIHSFPFPFISLFSHLLLHLIFYRLLRSIASHVILASQTEQSRKGKTKERRKKIIYEKEESQEKEEWTQKGKKKKKKSARERQVRA